MLKLQLFPVHHLLRQRQAKQQFLLLRARQLILRQHLPRPLRLRQQQHLFLLQNVFFVVFLCCPFFIQFLVSSFNIQVFGTTKYGKEPVKNQIVEILQRYDIATIQEIRDISETAFPSLVNDINVAVDKYDWFTGERQGTTSSKEQVGFIWDRNMFSKVNDLFVL